MCPRKVVSITMWKFNTNFIEQTILQQIMHINCVTLSKDRYEQRMIQVEFSYFCNLIRKQGNFEACIVFGRLIHVE